MKKNKTAMRAVSKILLVCLAINTLPVSFPVHAKTLTPQERAALRTEIDRDIKQVKITVNKLNFAKNAAPVAIGLTGAAITVVIAVLAGILILVLRKKIIVDFKNKITKLQEMIKKQPSVTDALKSFKIKFSITESQDLIKHIDTLQIELSLPQNMIETKRIQTHIKKIWPIIENMQIIKRDFMPNFNETLKVDLFLGKDPPSVEKLKPIIENTEINLFLMRLKNQVDQKYWNEYIKNKLKEFKPKSLKSQLKTAQDKQKKVSLWMGIATPIASLFMLLFGFLGTIGTAILVRLPFSKGSLDKTIKLARKLEGLEKEFPGILTSKQRVVLAKFKKLAGDLKIQAILQNMELKTKLTMLASGVIQQNKALTKELGGAEEAQKTLEKYFSRRLRKALLKRNLDTTDAKLKALSIKFLYNLAKSKVASMEKKYPMLQSATRDAVQKYMKEANKTLEKFNELLADAIVEGKITPKVKLEPIIPL